MGQVLLFLRRHYRWAAAGHRLESVQLLLVTHQRAAKPTDFTDSCFPLLSLSHFFPFPSSTEGGKGFVCSSPQGTRSFFFFLRTDISVKQRGTRTHTSSHAYWHENTFAYDFSCLTVSAHFWPLPLCLFLPLVLIGKVRRGE